MSELHTLPPATSDAEHAAHKSLWPVAAVILLVVFTPALLAWGMSLLRP
jgi:hypothetical protein